MSLPLMCVACTLRDVTRASVHRSIRNNLGEDHPLILSDHLYTCAYAWSTHPRASPLHPVLRGPKFPQYYRQSLHSACDAPLSGDGYGVKIGRSLESIALTHTTRCCTIITRLRSKAIARSPELPVHLGVL